MKRLITRPTSPILVAALAVTAATCTVTTARAASPAGSAARIRKCSFSRHGRIRCATQLPVRPNLPEHGPHTHGQYRPGRIHVCPYLRLERRRGLIGIAAMTRPAMTPPPGTR